MNYYYSKNSTLSFNDAIQAVTAELAKEGFGVLTEIDVTATLKKKLNVDFRNYRILGACNPPFAYKALQAEENIGVFLPCNVVVQETLAGEVRISAVNPLMAMQAVQNPSLEEVASEISRKLERVIQNTD